MMDQNFNLMLINITGEHNITGTNPSVTESSKSLDVMMILSLILSSVGIFGNLNVLIVFLSHNKFRKKIPNIFIINQVSISHNFVFGKLWWEKGNRRIIPKNVQAEPFT